MERIGVGSLGEVFRARRRRDGREVALKRLSRSASDTYEVTEMLEAGARLVETLDPPGISGVVEVGAVDDTHFIAYEYFPGRDLRALQDRTNKPIPIDVAIAIAAKVAEA